MRVLVEQMKDRKLDLTDGIKVGDKRGWVQVIADSDEPVLHIYAEGTDLERLRRAGDRDARPGRGNHRRRGGRGRSVAAQLIDPR